MSRGRERDVTHTVVQDASLFLVLYVAAASGPSLHDKTDAHEKEDTNEKSSSHFQHILH